VLGARKKTHVMLLLDYLYAKDEEMESGKAEHLLIVT
jgi:hypothetical protein